MTTPTGQLAFDLAALIPKPLLECGRHDALTDEHITECIRSCAFCGETLTGWFDYTINHGAIYQIRAEGVCSKQWTLFNHMRRCELILTGRWVHEPVTNCYAHQHADGNYFRKGVPFECVRAEYEQKRTWLIASGIPVESLGVAA